MDGRRGGSLLVVADISGYTRYPSGVELALRGGRGQRLLYALAGRRMRGALDANLRALTAFVEQPATIPRSASGAE